MEFNGRVRTAKIGSLICATVLCLIGIFMIVRPDTSLTILCRIVGGVLMADGIIRLIGYFSRDMYRLAFQFDLGMGIFFLILGALLIFNSAAVIKFFHVVLGLVALVDGIMKIQTAKDAKIFGLEKWWMIGVTSGLTTVFGVILLINPFKGADALMIAAGVLLLLLGSMNFCLVFLGVKVRQQEKPKVITLEEDEYKEENE